MFVASCLELLPQFYYVKGDNFTQTTLLNRIMELGTQFKAYLFEVLYP